jgi:Sec-independent protein translocase protein TatA
MYYLAKFHCIHPAHSLFLSNGAPLIIIIIIIIIIITHTQTFPVWTEGTLQDLRQRKIKAEEIAVECMERLKEETRKMEETNNPLMKAMHFRNGK